MRKTVRQVSKKDGVERDLELVYILNREPFLGGVVCAYDGYAYALEACMVCFV